MTNKSSFGTHSKERETKRDNAATAFTGAPNKRACTFSLLPVTEIFPILHFSDMALEFGDVRYWMNSGKHMLALSISEFDPQRTLGRVPGPHRKWVCSARGRISRSILIALEVFANLDVGVFL